MRTLLIDILKTLEKVIPHGEICTLTITFFKKFNDIPMTVSGIFPKLEREAAIHADCSTKIHPFEQSGEDANHDSAVSCRC